jgi:NAD(P)-dependent dehydrogenase (short-subunit alcohol dehydrogenase family)
LAKYSITVNQVDPSAVESEIIDDLARRYAEGGEYTFESYKAAIASSIPLGRLASPSDIASCVAYLASEGAGFITGQSIAVDGGVVA